MHAENQFEQNKSSLIESNEVESDIFVPPS